MTLRNEPAVLGHAWFCDRIAPEIERFADLVTGIDLAQPVPSCGPDWDVADLIEHVGSVHRWVERMVRVLAPERIPSAEMDLQVPEARDALPAWLRAGAAPLVGALRGADPDAAMWSWGAGKHVRFWSRRMVHETAIHRIDAEMTLGRAPTFDATLAADGVGEFLQNIRHAAYWAPNVQELKGNGETLVLAARDVDAAWTVVLEPAGFTWTRGAAQEAAKAPSVRVEATALDLDLFLWNRKELDDAAFAVTGDRALAAQFQQNADI